jgi:hypothetical protein
VRTAPRKRRHAEARPRDGRAGMALIECLRTPASTDRAHTAHRALATAPGGNVQVDIAPQRHCQGTHRTFPGRRGSRHNSHQESQLGLDSCPFPCRMTSPWRGTVTPKCGPLFGVCGWDVMLPAGEAEARRWDRSLPSAELDAASTLPVLLGRECMRGHRMGPAASRDRSC